MFRIIVIVRDTIINVLSTVFFIIIILTGNLKLQEKNIFLNNFLLKMFYLLTTLILQICNMNCEVLIDNTQFLPEDFWFLKRCILVSFFFFKLQIFKTKSSWTNSLIYITTFTIVIDCTILCSVCVYIFVLI